MDGLFASLHANIFSHYLNYSTVTLTLSLVALVSSTSTEIFFYL